MASSRTTYQLHELCEFTNGFAFKSSDYVQPSEETIEVFRMGYIERGGGFKEDSTPVHVPREYGRNLDKFLLRPGDVTIAMTDMKDRVAILANTARVSDPDRFVLNQRVGCIRVKRTDILDAKFFYYYSNSEPHIRYLRSRANSGVQVNLGTAAIKESELILPSLAEQQAIAHILGTLDDKIELSRQMNATLESMAQTLFKSWFVDFDPVIDNALAAGNPIPEPLQARADRRAVLGDKRRPLPEAIREQFPSSFVFTEEMGWVPEGWSTAPLDQIANYKNGLALQKFRPENDDNYLPVVKIAQLRAGYTDGQEKASPDITPECIIDDGDVVFSWSGSLMVDIWCGGKAALNQHLFKVTSESYPKWFYYQYTCIHLQEFQRIAADKAVTMGHIKREHLSQATCAAPVTENLDACSVIFEPLMSRVINNRMEIRKLEKLRDTLLPRLLSGQLRIPDAEKQLAEVI